MRSRVAVGRDSTLRGVVRRGHAEVLVGTDHDEAHPSVSERQSAEPSISSEPAATAEQSSTNKNSYSIVYIPTTSAKHFILTSIFNLL